MQRETRTYLRYTLRKDFRYNYKAILSYSKALATKYRVSNKSLLFLALAYLKDLELSSKKLLALVILVSANIAST
ncbi:hypothetical protein HBI93_253300 [Parastagonospora nodorum]|nr:hypothetical protein HBI93_253300 [Parastagonospora nodorum]